VLVGNVYDPTFGHDAHYGALVDVHAHFLTGPQSIPY
jgi:hypothetical protein